MQNLSFCFLLCVMRMLRSLEIVLSSISSDESSDLRLLLSNLLIY